jgi:hypothetical protein
MAATDGRNCRVALGDDQEACEQTYLSKPQELLPREERFHRCARKVQQLGQLRSIKVFFLLRSSWVVIRPPPTRAVQAHPGCREQQKDSLQDRNDA